MQGDIKQRRELLQYICQGLKRVNLLTMKVQPPPAPGKRLLLQFLLPSSHRLAHLSLGVSCTIRVASPVGEGHACGSPSRALRRRRTVFPLRHSVTTTFSPLYLPPCQVWIPRKMEKPLVPTMTATTTSIVSFRDRDLGASTQPQSSPVTGPTSGSTDEVSTALHYGSDLRCLR